MSLPWSKTSEPSPNAQNKVSGLPCVVKSMVNSSLCCQEYGQFSSPLFTVLTALCPQRLACLVLSLSAHLDSQGLCICCSFCLEQITKITKWLVSILHLGPFECRFIGEAFLNHPL